MLASQCVPTVISGKRLYLRGGMALPPSWDESRSLMPVAPLTASCSPQPPTPKQRPETGHQKPTHSSRSRQNPFERVVASLPGRLRRGRHGSLAARRLRAVPRGAEHQSTDRSTELAFWVREEGFGVWSGGDLGRMESGDGGDGGSDVFEGLDRDGGGRSWDFSFVAILVFEETRRHPPGLLWVVADGLLTHQPFSNAPNG